MDRLIKAMDKYINEAMKKLVRSMQINDWVRVDLPLVWESQRVDYSIHGNCQVSCVDISDEEDYTIITRGHEGTLIRGSEFEPIPLTEEILKANGFVYNEDYSSWGLNGFVIYNFHHQLCADLCERYVDLKYVHQLQHLLRDCGLDELADNFKVE